MSPDKENSASPAPISATTAATRYHRRKALQRKAFQRWYLVAAVVAGQKSPVKLADILPRIYGFWLDRSGGKRVLL